MVRLGGCAQWLCSVAVQRVCSGCAQWLGSVAVLWVLAGSDIKVTSTSSVSCLAAANNFKDRCQTTSRPRSSSSSSSSKFAFILPCKFLYPPPKFIQKNILKKKKGMVEQSGAGTT
ncbi:hypothetical protein EV1_034563 [Malus domestica]